MMTGGQTSMMTREAVASNALLNHSTDRRGVWTADSDPPRRPRNRRRSPSSSSSRCRTDTSRNGPKPIRSGAVVVDSLTTNDGVMVNSGKAQNLSLYKVIHLTLDREMWVDIDVRHFNSRHCRPSKLTKSHSVIAVIRHHTIII